MYFVFWSTFDGAKIEGLISRADKVIGIFSSANEEKSAAFSSINAV